MNIAMIVNNCPMNLTCYMKDFVKSLRETGKMPEELSDLITVNFVVVNGETRAILNAA